MAGVPRAATTSDAFNAIAEPIRREILRELARGERPVGGLVERLELTQPQASKHLQVLRQVDLVRSRTVGRQRVYRINAEALKPVHDWVAGFAQLWNERMDRIDDLLTELQAPSPDNAPTESEDTASENLPKEPPS